MAYNDIKSYDPIVNKMTIEKYLELKRQGLIKDNEIYEIVDSAETIDNIISGKQIVGRAMLATNLTSDTRIEVADTFGARITATNNNEIVSAIGDEGTAEIASIGGFSVKQIVKNGDFSNGVEGWQANGGKISNIQNGLLVEHATTASGVNLVQFSDIGIVHNVKYYITASFKAINLMDTCLLGLRGTTSGYASISKDFGSVSAGASRRISAILSTDSTITGDLGFQIRSTSGALETKYEIYRFMALNLTELGWDTLTVEQVEQLLGNKFYPYGITNTKPKTFKSIGENLWDYKYFYETLKAVNADNISYVEKDGRECIKITNPSVYHNKGIELYKGKFSANVRYRLIAEGFHETNQNLSLRYVYTDSTYSTAFFILSANTEKWHVSDWTSLEGKTIDYITINLNYNYPTYINTSKFQLQMLDNPETNFLPYTENTLQIPQVYQPYGMPSLPNGVRDRIVRVGEKWYFNQEVGRVVLNGSENWVLRDNSTNLTRYSLDDPLIVKKYTNNASYISNHKTNGIIGAVGIDLGITEGVRLFKLENQIIYYDSSINNLVDFKTYLSQNPLEIYYQLATPILTQIPTWLAQYLAYNYGREEILDTNGNTIPTHAVIKYYLDNKKQIETNTTNIADLLARVQALENK